MSEKLLKATAQAFLRRTVHHTLDRICRYCDPLKGDEQMEVAEKFNRSIHAAAKLTDEQFARFEQLEADAERIAENFPANGRFGYSTNQLFTDPAEWLNWKLFQIVEELESE